MAVASIFGAQMGLLAGNSGGAVQNLPPVYQVGGKERSFVEFFALTAQVAGTVIGVARIPTPFVLTGIQFLTDTSLGSTTISIGNANGSAAYVALQALTTINQKVNPTGLVSAQFCVPITTGYDGVTGNQVTPYLPGQGGGCYEDFLLTTAAATAPASGTLKLIFSYMID